METGEKKEGEVKGQTAPTGKKEEKTKEQQAKEAENGLFDHVPEWVKSLIPAGGSVVVTYYLFIKKVEDKVEELSRKSEQMERIIIEQTTQIERLKKKVKKVEKGQEDEEMKILNNMNINAEKYNKKVKVLS